MTNLSFLNALKRLMNGETYIKISDKDFKKLSKEEAKEILKNIKK